MYLLALQPCFLHLRSPQKSSTSTIPGQCCPPHASIHSAFRTPQKRPSSPTSMASTSGAKAGLGVLCAPTEWKLTLCSTALRVHTPFLSCLPDGEVLGFRDNLALVFISKAQLCHSQKVERNTFGLTSEERTCLVQMFVTSSTLY
jgi:hypothetical protein